MSHLFRTHWGLSRSLGTANYRTKVYSVIKGDMWNLAHGVYFLSQESALDKNERDLGGRRSSGHLKKKVVLQVHF